MYDFNKLDPTDRPFVLDQDNAVKWLKHQANALFDEAIADEHNGYGVGIAPDTASGVFEELVYMAQEILDKNWRFVFFGEHTMKESHVFVEECRTIVQPYTKETLRFAESTMAKIEKLNNNIAEFNEARKDSSYQLKADEVKSISEACDAIEQLSSILKGE